MSLISIYVDGACKGNPGPGGWGLVAFHDGQYLYHKYQHTEEQTTNNREELKAMIEAFDDGINIYSNNQIIIYSDSAYVVNMINDWIWSWAKKDWQNSKKKTVENIDLVKTLYNYLNINFFRFQVLKVQGHHAIIGNEFADALATGNIKKIEKLVAMNPLMFENFKKI